jgi:hypothetical protein
MILRKDYIWNYGKCYIANSDSWVGKNLKGLHYRFTLIKKNKPINIYYRNYLDNIRFTSNYVICRDYAI